MLAMLAMLVACGHDREPARAPPIPHLAPVRSLEVAPTEDPRTRRLTSYVELLSVDFVFYQLLAAFPGTPTTNRFAVFEYPWGLPRSHSLRDLVATIDAATAAAAEAPQARVDAAVAAYVAALAIWWPKIESLNTYYTDQRFIDDEFARGRREAPEIAHAMTELAKLRVPMRAAVLAAWRELTHDAPSSPRAIVGRSWEACMAYEDRVMARANPDALDAAISRCRRAIAPVAALPDSLRAHLDEDLRRAAIEAGDDAVVHSPNPGLDTGYAFGELTSAYLAQWRDLPRVP
jgi:hypothetical protein